MPVNHYIDDSLELLRQMVRVPSLTFEEATVRDLICSALDRWGVPYVVANGNIVARSEGYDPSRPTLVLDAHIDTVPANGGYTRDPFDPGDDPARIWGLGSNDDGGSVAAMIAVFRALRTEPLPVNLLLALCCEEERSGPDGAAWLYSPAGLLATDPSSGMPRWGIVGEPTGLRAATSERGLLVLDGEAKGVSGHAARGEGVNALYIAMDDIAALRAHRFGRVSPVMGEVKLSVTQISAGTAHNVIPDSCRFVVDMRPTEQYTNEELLAEVQALCRSTLTPRNLTNRSSASRPGSALVRTVEALGIETFSSPTTSDWMRMGFDAVKIGPGESSRSHRPDEYVECAEIAAAVDIYTDIILNIYGNTLE